MREDAAKSDFLFVAAAMSVILSCLIAAAVVTGVIPGVASQKDAAQPARAATAAPPLRCSARRAARSPATPSKRT